MEKKTGWIKKLASMSDETKKKRNLKMRTKEIRRGYESLLDEEERKIGDLEGNIISLQEELINTDPGEGDVATKEKIKKINRLLNELEVRKDVFQKDTKRMKEALEDGELLVVSDEAE